MLDVYFQNMSNVPASVAHTAYGVLNASTLVNTHSPQTKQSKTESGSDALYRSQAYGVANRNSNLVLDLLNANKEYKEVALVQPVIFA